MDIEVVKKVLQDVHQFVKIKILAISGGEPTLYLDKVLKIGVFAKPYEIDTVVVSTNCSWAKDVSTAKEILTQFANAGINHANYSADAFHAEYVPFERVENAIIAAEEVGFGYGIGSIFMSHDTPSLYDMHTQEIVNLLRKIATNGIFGNMSIKFIGRAASLLDLYEGKLYIPDEVCDTTKEGISFCKPESVSIDLYGRVCICPPTAIGNVIQKPLSKILTDWDYKQHPIIKVLVEEGPLGLTKLPEADGYKLKAGYMSKCHLCYDIRTHLSSYFPQYLAIP